MSLLKYIPLQLIFFQIIGVLIGFYIPFSPRVIGLLLALSITILAIIYYKNRKKIIKNNGFSIIAFFVFILIGIASVTFTNNLNKKNHYTTHLSKTNNTATLIIDKIVNSNAYYDKYYATVATINFKKAQGKILVNIRRDSTDKKQDIGHVIFTSARFDSINKPLNPYQFNYKKYLERQQIYHQIAIKNSEYFLLKKNHFSLKALAFLVRKKINIALKKSGFKGDELAIINALLLGQRQEISKDVLQNYQNAGAIHILAVSGLHIGILLWILNFLLKPLEKLRKGIFIKLTLIVLLLWGYAFVAGLSASVVRAVTMFTAIAIVIILKQPKNSYKALIISIFFLLLFHPRYLFDVGFQLSYLAVFFIVWVQPLLYRMWRPSLKIVDYLWQLLTVSMAAQIGVLPLSLFYFHQFPGLFFVTNILIIPFLGTILGLGIFVIVLALFDILPSFLATFYEKVILLLNITVEWVSNQESFLFQNVSFTLASVGISFFIVITFFKWVETKRQVYLTLALVGVIGFQLYSITEKYLDSSKNEFIIFNKSKHSVLGIRKGQNIHIHHSLDSLALYKENSIKAYLTSSGTKLSSSKNPPENIYFLTDKKILVIDSLGIYNIPDFLPDYVLLRQSPTINLERLIKTLKPKLIIADASNYKSYVLRWKKTCKNYNIKFHYTVTDGAFIEK